MRFSLILPFRGRPELLENMFETLVETTDRPDLIEVLIRRDADDDAKINLKKYRHLMEITVKTGPRSKHFTKDYINPLARLAKGRWIITINDDSEFMTDGWDDKIDKIMSYEAENVGDDILLGLTRDEIPRKGENPMYPHFSSFPVIGREFVTALGYLQDERCYIWGPDHLLAALFREWDVRRLVSLTHITIGHLSTHTGRRKTNENYEYFKQIDAKHMVNIGDIDRTPIINKLKLYAEEKSCGF